MLLGDTFALFRRQNDMGKPKPEVQWPQPQPTSHCFEMECLRDWDTVRLCRSQVFLTILRLRAFLRDRPGECCTKSRIPRDLTAGRKIRMPAPRLHVWCLGPSSQTVASVLPAAGVALNDVSHLIAEQMELRGSSSYDVLCIYIYIEIPDTPCLPYIYMPSNHPNAGKRTIHDGVFGDVFNVYFIWRTFWGFFPKPPRADPWVSRSSQTAQEHSI